MTEISPEILNRIDEVKQDYGKLSGRSKEIGSCCFRREAYDYEVDEGQDPSNYYVLDCVEGVSRGVCSGSRGQWIEEKPAECTACDRSDPFCLQSGICNQNLKNYSVQQAKAISESISQRLSSSSGSSTTTDTGTTSTPPPSPPSPPSSGGGYGY